MPRNTFCLKHLKRVTSGVVFTASSKLFKHYSSYLGEEDDNIFLFLIKHLSNQPIATCVKLGISLLESRTPEETNHIQSLVLKVIEQIVDETVPQANEKIGCVSDSLRESAKRLQEFFKNPTSNDPEEKIYRELKEFNIPHLLTEYATSEGRKKLIELEVWEGFIDAADLSLSEHIGDKGATERSLLANHFFNTFGEKLWNIIHQPDSPQASSATHLMYLSRISQALNLLLQNQSGPSQPLLELFTKLHEQLTKLQEQLLQKESSPEKVPEKQFNCSGYTPGVFIGRDEILEDISQQLKGGGFVNLTAMAGMGKTWIATHYATTHQQSYKDGVYIVELAKIVDETLVCNEIAKAFGYEDKGNGIKRKPADILELLQSKQALLVLDNCEHLLECCHQIISELEKCDYLHIIATSTNKIETERMNLLEVPPMKLPSNSDFKSITEAEATRVFVKRVQKKHSNFKISSDNAKDIHDICSLLEGIPLAIRLVAARYPFRTLAQILTGLKKTTLDLEDQTHCVKRHRKVEAALKWSCELLTPTALMLLQKLSVFRGGFSQEALHAIFIEDGYLEDQLEKDLMELTNYSLVSISTNITKEQDPSQQRFFILETVRNFGAKALDKSPDKAQVLEKHRDWCITFTSKHAKTLEEGGNQSAASAQLYLEHDNIRAAMDWCTTEKDLNNGLRLGGAMWRFWETRGFYSEAMQELGALIGVVEEKSTSVDEHLVASAYAGYGMILYRQGEYIKAQKLALKALDIEERFDPTSLRAAICRSDLGNIEFKLGQYEASLASHQHALADFIRLGHNRQIAIGLNNCVLIGLLELQGKFEDLAAYLTESRDRFERGKHSSDLCYPIIKLGWLHFWYQDPKPAIAYFQTSYEDRKSNNSDQGMLDSLEGLVWVCLETNDCLLKASDHFLAAVTVAEKINTKIAYCKLLESAAFLANKKNKFKESLACLRRAADLRVELGTPLSPIAALKVKTWHDEASSMLSPTDKAYLDCQISPKSDLDLAREVHSLN